VIGIGTDIVEVKRIENAWRRHGARFEARILTPVERLVCHEKEQPWRFLAKRFAAKEAVSKCVGTGIGVSLSWQDIELRTAMGGAPEVFLSPRGRAVAHQKGGSRVMLSLSDERAYAVAFAVLLA